MADHKTDEQMRSEFIPKIKAFADALLNGEKAKRIYEFLKPYHYDTGGWHLYWAAKGILQMDAYSEFPTEETMGYFDNLDGHGLLKWLEIGKFAEKVYERMADGRGYEKLKHHTLDENSPMYQEYQNKLWNATIRSMALTLSDKQPYLLEGFWNRLSFIKNILINGFPTRDELNDKIKQEAKAVFDSASVDDLTGFHSEVEIKHKIRNELYDISMTAEMVEALWIKDNVLDDAYSFYLEADRVNQVQLAMFEYLEEAEHDYLAFRVFDLSKLEYEDYLDRVKELPPEKIIEEAYKISTLHDIHIGLDPDTSEYSTEQLKALRSVAGPLCCLYQEWQRRDFTHMNDIKDVISDVADKLVSDKEENSFEDEREADYEDEPDL